VPDKVFNPGRFWGHSQSLFEGAVVVSNLSKASPSCRALVNGKLGQENAVFPGDGVTYSFSYKCDNGEQDLFTINSKAARRLVYNWENHLFDPHIAKEHPPEPEPLDMSDDDVAILGWDYDLAKSFGPDIFAY